MREAVEEIKRKTFQNHLRGSEGILNFDKNSDCFKNYIYGVSYINDKICMVALREMLNMKMLSEVLSLQINLMRKSDIKTMAVKWFGNTKINITQVRASQEANESENNKASINSVALNQFVKIFDNQEQAQEQVKNIDNRSQFSDFSLKFNQLRRTSEDFFDF